MTKSIGASLLAHYASRTPSVASCWKITRTDGVVKGFTEHDKDLVISGVTYVARGGFMPSNFDSQTRLSVDNLEAVGFLDSETISASDLSAGVYDYALVEVFLVNWNDLSMGQDTLMKGRIGEVRIDRNTFFGELRGLTNAYSQTIGQIYQPTCRAIFGDSKCTKPLGPLTVTGTLSAVSADGLVLSDPARTEAGPVGPKTITAITKATSAQVTATAHGLSAGQVAYVASVGGMTEINGQWYLVKTVVDANNVTLAVDSTNFTTYISGGTISPSGDAGYFGQGKITMTSGVSNGLSTEVKVYSPGSITLQLQFPKTVAAGDTYSLVAGCGKRFVEDCVNRFANGINFRGEPHLPGMDKIMRTGGA